MPAPVVLLASRGLGRRCAGGMDAVLLQRYLPEEYHRRFLADGVRADGRGPTTRRPAWLQRGVLGSAAGSASVRLGNSAAVAGVRAEVTEASPELPVTGHVTATVELPPLCSSAFRDRQTASSAATFLASTLRDVLNSPQVLDAAQLHIREGELCWTLSVHVVCLNYDGNAFDLCILAALAALEDTALPALGDDAAAPSGLPPRLVALPEGTAGAVSEARRLVLKSRPLPATFAQLPGDVWVVDPTAGEESLGASVSLCLVGGRWLVYHRGGGATADRFLSELMPVARDSVPELTALLDGHGAAADDGMLGRCEG